MLDKPEKEQAKLELVDPDWRVNSTRPRTQHGYRPSTTKATKKRMFPKKGILKKQDSDTL